MTQAGLVYYCYNSEVLIEWNIWISLISCVCWASLLTMGNSLHLIYYFIIDHKISPSPHAGKFCDINFWLYWYLKLGLLTYCSRGLVYFSKMYWLLELHLTVVDIWWSYHVHKHHKHTSLLSDTVSDLWTVFCSA